MPFVLYSTAENYYLYDRTKNRAVRIDEMDYQNLSMYQQGACTEGVEQTLARFQSQGYCLKNTIETIEHPLSSELEFIMKEQMRQCILQVTQACNLRCEYCTYSGLYNNRTHSGKRMSMETARKAVDFLVSHSSALEKVIVGFYGGEPLLEFALIKEVIDYIEKTYHGKQFTYSMTTNGTLLTDEVVDYLAEKNFSIVISLDGPKEVHNRHRRFADGRGSFDVIKENLLRMEKRYPDFYRTCSTNTVLSPEQDYRCVEEFLEISEIVSPLNSQIGLISDTGLDEPVSYDQGLNINNEGNKLAQLLSLFPDKQELALAHYFGNYLDQIERINTTLHAGPATAKKGHPGGPCIAGAIRGFVDTEGNIYPCEKVNECDEMRIGTVCGDFDVDNINRIVNIARTTEKECKECWAFLFCGLCVAASIDGSGISAQKRLMKCYTAKKGALQQLKALSVLKENGFEIEKNA